MNEHHLKCFACDRPIRAANPSKYMAITSDGAQNVYVGPDCYKLIARAGAIGYQPKGISPRLFTLAEYLKQRREKKK